MKNREKREVALVASGILLGTAIAAPVATAVLTAQQSSQKIYVDGQQVQIEAYSINGNNYAKIRDLGKAVGFLVTYDATANMVQIDSTAPYQDDTVPQTSRTVTLPTDGSKYVPKVGDLIPCDDGTTYEVKDVIRWENNVFMDGPMPDMPTPTCDWGLFPHLELPKVEVRHFSDQHGDDLFVRNLYEVRRMVYTIYNAIGEEPDAWRDSKPLCKIYTEIPPEYEPYTGVFWPWRSSEITKAVHALQMDTENGALLPLRDQRLRRVAPDGVADKERALNLLNYQELFLPLQTLMGEKYIWVFPILMIKINTYGMDIETRRALINILPFLRK